MQDLPTIVVIGSDVDMSWVSLVKAALTDTPHFPIPPAEAPIITIPGSISGPEFIVTLEPTTWGSDQKAFTVKSVLNTGNGIVLLVPIEPLDQTQERTGWMRKNILEAIENSIHLPRTTPVPQARILPDPITAAMLANPISMLPPAPDFEIYFHPDLSTEQIELSFAAMADYYRACGGTGLRTEFEEQDVRVPEVVYDGPR
jgi:hypothetical protein